MLAIEEKRFQQIIGGHRAGLMNYAKSLSRNGADAEDLVQETLVRAYAYRERIRETEAVGTYLKTILRNLFINEYRKRSHLPGLVSLDQEELPDGVAATPMNRSPESVTLRQMEADELLKAIAALPPMYRIVLTLSDLEGFSYDEIAQKLDLPIGTVRSRLSRARHRVQRAVFAWRH